MLCHKLDWIGLWIRPQVRLLVIDQITEFRSWIWRKDRIVDCIIDQIKDQITDCWIVDLDHRGLDHRLRHKLDWIVHPFPS